MAINFEQLVSRQHLIISYIKEKIDIVNAIKSEFENNTLNNQFLLFTSHIYYRSIVVDLCSLFVDRKTEKNNFHLLYGAVTTDILKPEAISLIKDILEKHKEDILIINNLRDKEYAHYDFLTESISFNFDNFSIVNNLYQSAISILEITGSERINEDNTCEYDLMLDDYLSSFKRLLQK